ncbi:FHA domain-containing protein [Lysobacter koreensis]|uniref:FHA domain-containing protein n=1 Tax=Lysobacter koreensis TaxID=266122 RepID=A0ABW2YMA4_9GAMM
MPARLIAYPPDAAALTRWLEPGERLRIGRSPDCDLVLDHPSVSRAHAELYYRSGDRDGDSEQPGWHLRDLGSKNGCYADGIAIDDHRLPDNAWLRLGDAYCEFAQFDAAKAGEIRGRQQERRALSAAMTRQMTAQDNVGSLLDDVLRGVVELADCDRGFLLLAQGDDFAVGASLVLDPDALDTRAFSGSVGAVQRALATGTPVVVNRIADEAWLAGRASVIGSGLQCLVCLPLLERTQVVGAVYADRRGGPAAEFREPITQFDLDLLGAFAESATLWLLARRAMQALDAAPRWATIVQKQSLATSAAPPASEPTP